MRRVEGTLAVASGVRIALFSHEATSLDDVAVRVLHQTAIAAIVAVGARTVDQLLLRERDELARVHRAGGFHRAGGREGPTVGISGIAYETVTSWTALTSTSRIGPGPSPG